MNALEFSILRSVMANLRRVRRHIGRGDLGHAFLMFSNARHELAFGLGIVSGEPGTQAPSWERVRRCEERIEAQLLRAITRAAVRPQPADPAELSAAIAQGILVLRTRDGVDVSDDQARERGRNVATALLGIYSVSERPPTGSAEWFPQIERGATPQLFFPPNASCGIRHGDETP